MAESMPLDDATVPELARHFRLQWEPAQQAHVLLYPEGMVRFNGGAGEIMKRIDGRSTIGAIIEDLQRAFPGAELRADVLRFLREAHGKGWIRARPPG